MEKGSAARVVDLGGENIATAKLGPGREKKEEGKSRWSNCLTLFLFPSPDLLAGPPIV